MGCILKGGGGLYGRLSLGAVVLAAGQGSRMGYRPKCLLEIAGVSLIRRQLIALSGAGVDQLVVVLGHYADLIRPLIEDFRLRLLICQRSEICHKSTRSVLVLTPFMESLMR